VKVCLVLTHQCNLGCDYCYAGEKFARSMSLEIGLKSLKLAFSRSGPLEISFFGGEPMIAFDSMARLTRVAARWAKRRKRALRFAVTTNATILQKKHLHFLRHYNFFAGISVDGVEEVQDRQRPFLNGRGSGELVWRNLEAACQVLDDFRVLMVVRPETLDSLPRAVERMYRLGVSKISLLPETEADWSACRDRLRDVFAQMARVCYLSMLTDEPLWISPFVELHPSRRATALYSGEESPGGCGFGSDEVAISPAGNFYPCARLVGPDRRTEVRIGTLDSGFDGPRIRALQQQADESMAQCGSGGCKCLALMPGDSRFQLGNVALFTQITGEVCQFALEGVAA
jgi:uncharacterized protein